VAAGGNNTRAPEVWHRLTRRVADKATRTPPPRLLCTEGVSRFTDSRLGQGGGGERRLAVTNPANGRPLSETRACLTEEGNTIVTDKRQRTRDTGQRNSITAHQPLELFPSDTTILRHKAAIRPIDFPTPQKTPFWNDRISLSHRRPSS